MINLDIVLKKYNINPLGIIHIGGHKGEEYEEYKSLGIDNQIWIEAIPSYYEQISNKLSSDINVKIYNFAIYDVEKEIDFNVCNNGASSSILPLKGHKKYYPNITVDGKIQLTTKRMDNLLEEENIIISNYNGLSMDVQGVELNVAKSFGDKLNMFDFIISEVNTEELYENCCLINELDDYLNMYNFKRVETLMWDNGSVGWGDGFYIKNKI
jgi:FkbM family methyltransferase